MRTSITVELTSSEAAEQLERLFSKMGKAADLKRRKSPEGNALFEVDMYVDTDADLIDLLCVCLFYLDRDQVEINQVVKKLDAELALTRVSHRS